MWRHYSVVARPIRHSLFYSGQSSIRWVPLETKLPKSNQIRIKNLIPRPFKNLSLKLLFDVIFHLCLANPPIFVLKWPTFSYMITTGSQTSQITLNWNKKTYNHILSPCQKTWIEVDVWCHFSVVARAIPYSLFYRRYFLITWIILNAKLPKFF